ncbi:hypothetical protein BC332_12385 [Capsicum chinense]|nr:hypothetical protein BC332_12385 [Capsicum chinense]
MVLLSGRFHRDSSQTQLMMFPVAVPTTFKWEFIEISLEGSGLACLVVDSRCSGDSLIRNHGEADWWCFSVVDEPFFGELQARTRRSPISLSSLYSHAILVDVYVIMCAQYCWAYASIGAMSAAVSIKRKKAVVPLSKQHLTDCLLEYYPDPKKEAKLKEEYCWAYASIGAMSAAVSIKSKKVVVPLSKQHLTDCLLEYYPDPKKEAKLKEGETYGSSCSKVIGLLLNRELQKKNHSPTL